MEVFEKVSISARTRAARDLSILQYTHRHTTRDSVSWILWKCPNTGWCVDLLKGERRRRNDGEGGEDEFIHQVSLRVQSVLHCSSGHQSQTGSRLSRLTRPEGCGPGLGCLWAPPAGPPSPPGPVSPGYECWSPPETCTSAPEAHWWDLPHTGREGAVEDKWRAAEEMNWWDEKKKRKEWKWVVRRREESQTRT